jgi:aspartate carbamoyltransferase catalytic subunit
VINVGSSDSSTQKGETLLDTARTLQAMTPDALVIRHKESRAAHFLAKWLKNTAIINGGDGMNEHPTQALLDLATLNSYFEEAHRSLTGLKIAIVGDILHSRVARSNVWAHTLLGNQVTLIGPESLVPDQLLGKNCFGAPRLNGLVKIERSLKAGLKDADVVMVLRMQLERQSEFFVPSLQEYTDNFCVSEDILKEVAPRCVVLHPGPVNRGLEITSQVVDGPRSLVERQVNFGVALRMAVLFNVITHREQHFSLGASL